MPMRTAAEALQAGTPDTSDIQRIRDRGSRTHEAYLSALESRRQQQAPAAASQGQGAPVGAGGDLQEYARSRLAQLGFNDPGEWQALQQLWQKESGWDPNAVNRSSGAFGIAQILPSAHPTANRNMSAQEQIEWGLNYIRNRYGAPSRAWQHSQRTNWY